MGSNSGLPRVLSLRAADVGVCARCSIGENVLVCFLVAFG